MKKEKKNLPLSIPVQKNSNKIPAPRRYHRWLRLSIDLNQPKQRRVLLIVMIGLFSISISLSVIAYEGYTYTESSAFCGTLCHTMAPEFTRYELSAHSNVECVQCHVGPGLEYYVKSKLEGLHQVYAILTNTYRRPISSPVHNLRPARETCETCHTPSSFKDNIVKKTVHYENDEFSTPVVSTLILKMGGWQETTGESLGIHWHINNPVYYLPGDEQRQKILWVGVKQKDGSLKEFYSQDLLLTSNTSLVDEARIKGEIREMDCIDCHNRTAHDIPPPEELIDKAIETGAIDSSLPFIRSMAVKILKEKYPSMLAAVAAIEGLADYYRVNKPQVYAEQGEKVVAAIAYLKQVYSSTNFPEMGQDWETNPNNQDHSYTLGCFRCHDGKHASLNQEGEKSEVIPFSCNLCHTVPIVGKGSELLIEAPVIVGPVPPSHEDFSWTVEHRNITEEEKKDCFQCHGQGFCNNGVCHNLSHPPDMLFTHADEYRKQGDQVCYTCHQDIHCIRCHPDGIIKNP